MLEDIDQLAGALLEVAGKVGANTANIPQLQATAPVLGQIVDEAVVQDGYMSALTTGLAGALIVIRAALESASSKLATLADALEGVETEHLRPLK